MFNRFPRTWSKRRVIASNKVIIFAKTDSTEEAAILDAIPLFQVEEIRIWDDNGVPRSAKETQDFKHAEHVSFDETAHSNEDARQGAKGAKLNVIQSAESKTSKQTAPTENTEDQPDEKRPAPKPRSLKR